MKKKSSKSSSGNKAAIVATMLAIPMISTPAIVYGQKGETPTVSKQTRAEKSYIKFANLQHKVGSASVTILGVGGGNTIYEKPNGSKFYIDPQTGDMKPVSEKNWVKMTSNSRASTDFFIKLGGVKGESTEIKLLGVDADGSVIHQKADGTKFTVNPTDGHVTVLK